MRRLGRWGVCGEARCGCGRLGSGELMQKGCGSVSLGHVKGTCIRLVTDDGYANSIEYLQVLCEPVFYAGASLYLLVVI